jgi:Ca-activated chloride channel family protein
MAHVGRGAVAFVGVDESFAPAIDQFYERISHPALTDIGIDWGGLEVSDVYPEQIPDLFVGRPVILTGRLGNDPGQTTVRVRGLAGDEREQIDVSADSRGERHPAIASIWARTRIADLENEQTWNGTPTIAGEIKQVALAYNLMSAYSSFIA